MVHRISPINNQSHPLYKEYWVNLNSQKESIYSYAIEEIHHCRSIT